jgi:glucan phosphoethanolaminetransferase (alkaline phosphatase superfamily)
VNQADKAHVNNNINPQSHPLFSTRRKNRILYGGFYYLQLFDIIIPYGNNVGTDTVKKNQILAVRVCVCVYVRCFCARVFSVPAVWCVCVCVCGCVLVCVWYFCSVLIQFPVESYCLPI